MRSQNHTEIFQLTVFVMFADFLSVVFAAILTFVMKSKERKVKRNGMSTFLKLISEREKIYRNVSAFLMSVFSLRFHIESLSQAESTSVKENNDKKGERDRIVEM